MKFPDLQEIRMFCFVPTNCIFFVEKLSDSNSARFEVPPQVVNIPSPDVKASNPLYDVIFISEPAFAFQVVRKDTGEVL